MKTIPLFVPLALVLMVSPAAASWSRYDNKAAGFSLSLPLDRFAVDEETGARLSLRDNDGGAQLDVFAVANPDDLDVGRFRTMIEAADPQRRITYTAAGKSWFVLSGYLEDEDEPTVFYAKFMLNRAGTAVSAFEISYPAAAKADYDPIVERMEDSLTAPR